MNKIIFECKFLGIYIIVIFFCVFYNLDFCDLREDFFETDF